MNLMLIIYYLILDVQKYKNMKKMTWSIWDAYPPKFDRMKKFNPPGDRKFQGASFGTRFGCHSLSKTYRFL